MIQPPRLLLIALGLALLASAATAQTSPPGASPASLERLLSGLTTPGRYTVFAVPADQSLPPTVATPPGTRQVPFVDGVIYILPVEPIAPEISLGLLDEPTILGGQAEDGAGSLDLLPLPTPRSRLLTPCETQDTRNFAVDPDLCGHFGLRGSGLPLPQTPGFRVSR